jgi:hypothetical protein
VAGLTKYHKKITSLAVIFAKAMCHDWSGRVSLLKCTARVFEKILHYSARVCQRNIALLCRGLSKNISLLRQVI